MAPRLNKSAPKPTGGKQKSTVEQRRKLFVEAFLSSDGNATYAATVAGFSAKTAASQGSRLLKNVKIQQEIDKRRAEVLQKAQEATQLTIERVLMNLAQAIFFDPRKLYREDGSIKSIDELDDDTAQALVGFEAFEEFEGSGRERRAVGVTKKIKWLDKNTAREQALKHLGAFERDNKQPAEAMADAIAATAGLGDIKAAFDKRLGRKT